MTGSAINFNRTGQQSGWRTYLERDGVNFEEDLVVLEVWYRSFSHGEVVEPVRLREAVLAGRSGERHYADMLFNEQRTLSRS